MNANIASCGSGMDGMQDEKQPSLGWNGGDGGGQCSSEAAMKNVREFCLRYLSKIFIVYSVCSKGCHPDPLCADVEKELF